MAQGTKASRRGVITNVVRRFGVSAVLAASATACGLVLGLDDPQIIDSTSGPTADAARGLTDGSEHDGLGGEDGEIATDGSLDGGKDVSTDSKVSDSSDGAVTSGYDAAAIHFEGGTGAAWETRGTTFSPTSGSFADYWPMGARAFYGLDDNAGDDLFRYDSIGDDWAFLGAYGAPPTRGTAPTMALVEHGFYLVRSGAVYRVGDGTANDAGPWKTLLSNLPVTTNGTTTHDDSDVVLSLTEGASPMVIRYDLATNSFTTVATSIPGASSGPRLGWDSVTSRLFVAPASGADFYEVEAISGTTTPRTSCPEAFASRAFCADRSGHIYAAGDPNFPRTFWQYDTVKNTWKQLPDLPFDKGSTGSCIVSQDGWLYASNGAAALGNFARLALLP